MIQKSMINKQENEKQLLVSENSFKTFLSS